MFISALSLFTVDLLHQFTILDVQANWWQPPHCRCCWWSKNWSPCHSYSVTAWPFSHAANVENLKLRGKVWYLFNRKKGNEQQAQKLGQISTQNSPFCPCLAPLANEWVHTICMQQHLSVCNCAHSFPFKTAIIPPPPFPSWNNLECHKLHVDTVSLMPAWPPTPELLCPRQLQTEGAVASAVQWLRVIRA